MAPSELEEERAAKLAATILKVHSLPHDYGTWANLLPGPWDDEPNRRIFTANGFVCEARRNHMAAWCGYVYIPVDDPDFPEASFWARPVKEGQQWEWDGRLERLSPHYDWTFTDLWDGYLVLGFDCAHWGDLVPVLYSAQAGKEGSDLLLSGTYRDLNFVEQCLAKCTAQLQQVIHAWRGSRRPA